MHGTAVWNPPRRQHTHLALLVALGRQLPRLDSLIRLSGALGVEPAELLKGIHFEPADQHGKYRIARSKKRD